MLLLYFQLFASLFGVIAARATAANQLSIDAGLAPIQEFGILRLIVSSLHERVNLISFSLS